MNCFNTELIVKALRTKVIVKERQQQLNSACK